MVLGFEKTRLFAFEIYWPLVMQNQGLEIHSDKIWADKVWVAENLTKCSSVSAVVYYYCASHGKVF